MARLQNGRRGCAAGSGRTLPVGVMSAGGLLSRVATGADLRHAVGQTGARPRIFCKLACGRA